MDRHLAPRRDARGCALGGYASPLQGMGHEDGPIGKKGLITLPADLSQEHGLEVGDILTVVDVGDGIFVLSLVVSEVARQGDRVAGTMAEYGTATEEALERLKHERAAWYRVWYARQHQGSA